MSTYPDKTQCPKGHQFTVRRRIQSAGQIVNTRCRVCDMTYDVLAGPLPPKAMRETKAPTLERQIEARLVKRVGDVGGEVRKVQWIGRRGAPDRLVMLPSGRVFAVDQLSQGRTIWVELKAPGKAATFPANPHERAQHREHERMRKMGQRVEVIDSYEQIEELLK